MLSATPISSARLKIDRASKHIDEVVELLEKKRPFRWILETNAKAGCRSIYAERDEALIDDIAVICGDAIHNLRAAIDHAYSAIVAPVTRNEKSAKAVQFPFSQTAEGLEGAVKSRLAHKVSPEFFAAVIGLKPHGGHGGDELLYLIHALDISDKHTSLVPTANQVTVSGEKIMEIAPDIPIKISGTSVLGGRVGDFSWPIPPLSIDDWIKLKVPREGIVRQETGIPVDIVFRCGGLEPPGVVVPTLHSFVSVAKKAVGVLEGFA
ncbi:MAG: hypothetical protein ACR2RE_16465 [Geminicoccaceae bacterium]